MADSKRLLQDNQDFGNYRIMSLLGRGGMGEVYRVRHRVLKQEYAVKMLLPDFTGRTGRELFEEEARIMAELGQSSPYIVKVDDFGNIDNSYWLRMELANGFKGCITLADLMRNEEGQQMQLEPELFKELFLQILSGMDVAHKKVVHRDLKPTNILLFTDCDGHISARVSDFGLVSIVGEESFVEQSHKSMQKSISFGTDKSAGEPSSLGKFTDGLVGTWEYMSPEQQDRQPATVQSDIYSLGLIAFKALTGSKKPGFEKPSEQVSGLPQFWDELIMRSLKEDPQKRFSSVKEMRDFLVRGGGTAAGEKPAGKKSGGSVFSGFGGIKILLLLCGLVLGFYWFYLFEEHNFDDLAREMVFEQARAERQRQESQAKRVHGEAYVAYRAKDYEKTVELLRTIESKYPLSEHGKKLKDGSFRLDGKSISEIAAMIVEKEQKDFFEGEWKGLFNQNNQN